MLACPRTDGQVVRFYYTEDLKGGSTEAGHWFNLNEMQNIKYQRTAASLILAALLAPLIGKGLALIVLCCGLIKVFTEKLDELIFFFIPFICVLFFLQFFGEVHHEGNINFILSSYAVFVAYYLFGYCYLQKRRTFPMMQLGLIGIIFAFCFRTTQDELLKNIYFSGLIIWAISFLSIVKQCDQWREPLRRADFDKILAPIWNFPLFISYSVRELEKVKIKSDVDYLAVQKNAILCLLVLLPMFFFRNYVVLSLESGHWVKINLGTLLYTGVPGDLVEKMTLFSESSLGRLTPLLTIFTLGVLTLLRVLIKFSTSVVIANCLGFSIYYSVFEILKFRSFFDLMQKLYSIYARTIISLFYFRISKLNKKYSRFLKPNFIKILAIVIGGVGFHFILDILHEIDSNDASKILLYRLNYAPYLVILGFTLLNLKQKEVPKHVNSILLFAKRISAVFLFGLIQLGNYYLLEGHHTWMDVFLYLKGALVG